MRKMGRKRMDDLEMEVLKVLKKEFSGSEYSIELSRDKDSRMLDVKVRYDKYGDPVDIGDVTFGDDGNYSVGGLCEDHEDQWERVDKKLRKIL